MRAKRREALLGWDRWRLKEGLGGWAYVVACPVGPTASGGFLLRSISSSHLTEKNWADTATVDVKATLRKSTSTLIPLSVLPARPATTAEDELEDWNAYMSGLFEWVGMACLGAQRYLSQSYGML